MADQLVFVPVSTGQAHTLARQGHLPGPLDAFATTPALLAALDYTADQAEDAEYAALVLASVHGLTRHQERLVLVAEVPAAQVEPYEDEMDNGGVRLPSLSRAAVQSFFTDDPAIVIADAVAAATGLTIDQVWETEQVQALLGGADLLWHSVEELDRFGKDDRHA